MRDQDQGQANKDDAHEEIQNDRFA